MAPILVMKKPRVLILDNSASITGALRSIVKIAIDLGDEFSFSFIIPKHSNSRQWIDRHGFTDISELNFLELSKRPESILFYFPQLLVNVYKLKKYIRQKNIDIIHVNDLYNMLPPLARALGSRLPYVCHVRFLPNPFPIFLFMFWLRVHFRFAHKVILVSDFQRRLLPDNMKLIVIPGELPDGERYPEAIPGESGRKYFLYLSNLIKGKGQDYAIRAFELIHKQLPEWRMKFVGGDMGLKKNKIYSENLNQLVLRSGLADKIEWSGVTDDVEMEYKRSDIVLNFSESESFSMTCLEALYFGRPLIASDCGGPAEIIDHLVTGLLVENRNIEAMANAMLHLALNEQGRMEMALRARDQVRVKFRPENTTDRVKEVYFVALRK